MNAEHRDVVGAFHELHRCGPPWVHLDGVRDAIAGNEIDAVDADDAELFRHNSGKG